MLEKLTLFSYTDPQINDDLAVVNISCWMIICAILPFGFYRLTQSQWLIGAADILVCVLLLLLINYMRTSGRTYLPKLMFSIVCLSMMNVTVFLKGTDQIYWCFPSLVIVFYLLPPRVAFAICIAALSILFFIISRELKALDQVTITVTILLTLFVSLIFSQSKHSQQKKLQQMAMLDPLTGLGNRYALAKQLEQSVSLSNRTQQPVCAILFDIDYFKKINDNYGHNTGDQALITLADLFKQRVRASDSLFRLGGEEFLLVAEATELKDACELAEKFRELVANSEIVEGAKTTLSAGVAQFAPGSSIEQWLKQADEALYSAKKAGRNQVAATAR